MEFLTSIRDNRRDKTTSKPTATLLAREASLFLEILATGQAYCESTKDYELTIRPKYANDKLSTF